MEGFKASEFLKSFADRQNSVNPAKLEDGDRIRDDGLIICGKCGEPKQCYINIDDEKIKVPCTCRCRREEMAAHERRMKEEEERRTVQSLRIASLMSGKFQSASFDKYVRRKENEEPLKIARNYVDRFEDMKSRNQGLLFYGPVGTGKSYTAACIANALLAKQRSVIMTSFVKLLQDFRGENTEDNFIRSLDRVQLVIVDDLGVERNTDFALEKVYNVIDSRVRANKPLILTTNLSLDEMEDVQDIRYRRIYDRIFEVCYPVKFEGSSFRQVQAAMRRKQMRELLE